MSLHNSYNITNKVIISIIDKKAKIVSQHYCFSKSDLDDLKHEFIVAVMEKLDKYDPSKSSIQTFISKIIDNRSADLIEYRKSKCKAELESYSDLESIIDSISEINDIFRENTNADIINHLEIAFDIEQIYNILPDHLAEICKLLQTMSISKAAKVTGISRRTLHRYLKKIKSILSKNGFSDYL